MTLRSEKALVSLGLAALLHPTFQSIAAWATTRATSAPWWLLTPLDRLMPVVPQAVWPYLSWYPATAAVLVAGRETFRRGYLAYLLAFVVCIVGDLLFPITIDRPKLGHATGLSASVLQWVYSVDRPVNLFPSFHAAVAAVLWRLRPASRLGSAAVSAWVVALCAACVLTKQHYVLDVLAGLVVGGVAVAAVDAARLLLGMPPLGTEARTRAGRVSVVTHQPAGLV